MAVTPHEEKDVPVLGGGEIAAAKSDRVTTAHSAPPKRRCPSLRGMEAGARFARTPVLHRDARALVDDLRTQYTPHPC